MTLTLVLAMGSAAAAQETIGLGPSRNEMSFQGTGTHVINVVWENCNSDGCSMAGSATWPDQLGAIGTYKFRSSSPRPFKLVASAVGLFTVDQSAPISFTYTSPHATLEGKAQFTTVVQNLGSIAASLVGTLQVTGGNLGPAGSSDPGGLNLNVAVGKKNLSTLVDSTGSIQGEIDALSSLTTPSSCAAASTIPSTLNGTPRPGGHIWFNAAFHARGVHDGTYLHFQGGFIQFQTDDASVVIHVPNAVVTFSSSVNCASTMFETGTSTWQTTVPVNGSDEIFLSGVVYPIPASGLPGPIGAANWSESFSSNTPGVSIEWKWGATVFSPFNTDYNQLGVKAAQGSACPYHNSDHAGTPEKFARFAVGGALRGTEQTAGAWSTTVTAAANCP